MCADDDDEADDGENQQRGHHQAGGEEQKGSEDAIKELRYEKAVEELFEDVVGKQELRQCIMVSSTSAIQCGISSVHQQPQPTAFDTQSSCVSYKVRWEQFKMVMHERRLCACRVR